jgi:hypothetical protein
VTTENVEAVFIVTQVVELACLDELRADAEVVGTETYVWGQVVGVTFDVDVEVEVDSTVSGELVGTTTIVFELSTGVVVGWVPAGADVVMGRVEVASSDVVGSVPQA